jgi:hypothetical protein
MAGSRFTLTLLIVAGLVVATSIVLDRFPTTRSAGSTNRSNPSTPASARRSIFMLETLGLQGACDEALRTARELEPQVGTLAGENEGFGRCSASWSTSRTWRDRSSRPGSATLTLFR